MKKTPRPQQHVEIVNTLSQRIFAGALKPGEKLPTEKQLIEDMNVDRGSLRIALKQLESIGVLDIRHGDGMYIKSYIKNAGMDFLRTLFQQETAGETLLMDEYLMDEVCEFWMLLFPGILDLAITRYTTRGIKGAIKMLDQQAECIDDKQKMVELELKFQDGVAEIVNNTVLLLLFNSSRPLRKKLTEILMHCLDKNEIKDLIETKKDLLKNILMGSQDKAQNSIRDFREKMSLYRNELRKAAVSG